MCASLLLFLTSAISYRVVVLHNVVFTKLGDRGHFQIHILIQGESREYERKVFAIHTSFHLYSKWNSFLKQTFYPWTPFQKEGNSEMVNSNAPS